MIHVTKISQHAKLWAKSGNTMMVPRRADLVLQEPRGERTQPKQISVLVLFLPWSSALGPRFSWGKGSFPLVISVVWGIS